MNDKISIVLISTENSGNIGAVARVMKNFGFFNLILINPLADPHSDVAFGFAMHAADVLEHAEIYKFEHQKNWLDSYHNWLKDFFHSFKVIIGTSAKGITYKNITRMPIDLTNFDLSQLPNSERIAIVFGRESTGLTNSELQHMDFLIRIPSDPVYPTLNLSHAVAVILSYIYFSDEFSNKSKKEWRNVNIAGPQLKENILSIISDILPQLPLAEYRRSRTLTGFKNIIGRALVTEQEFEYLRNFFRKILLILDKPELIQTGHCKEIVEDEDTSE
ncbi:MAG: hypothetical protein DRO88_04775 [Promethearchaeia archaeon]|nr:MAG: hypothetical protein DRO88_04775 [Candidatus Lokiarchaeia archaeon]